MQFGTRAQWRRGLRIGALIELPLLAVAITECFGACRSTAHAMPMATLPFLIQLPGALVGVTLVLLAGQVLRGSAFASMPQSPEVLAYTLMYGATAIVEILCIATLYVALANDAS